MDITQLIADARAAAATDEPTSVDVDILIQETFAVVRFTALDGTAWTDLTATHPAREGSALDLNVGGYNIDGVVLDYPVDKILVTVGEAEAQTVDKKTWQDLVGILSGPDQRNLRTGVWGINHLDPQNRRIAAKKALAGEGKKKPSSPANSASRRGGSRAGSQPK